MGVELAVSMSGTGGTGTVPALIDASAYRGVQFWLWQASDSVVPANSFYLLAGDRAETSGYGVCDSSVKSGPTECVGPVVYLAPQAGWQFVQAAWGSFASLPNTGSGNEAKLDPATLTQFNFQVGQPEANATAGTKFDFCVLGLSFY